MTKISFKVSARTARLIGQENFAQADGAIIELVKNSYDADAKKCLVVFDILFEDIPEKLTITDYSKFLEKSDFQYNLYIINEEKEYILKKAINTELKDLLRAFFFQFNSIYIIDNGDGMTDDIIENHWMQIGTSNKRDSIKSNDGRIQTGAKGIGRFALDRLGIVSEMWTVPRLDETKNNIEIGYYWKMDWKQFEQENTVLSEIKADLIPKNNLNLNSFLKDRFENDARINTYLSKNDFSNGTIIKISNLKDIWGKNELAKLFNNLEALIPPKELKIAFDVNLYYLQEKEELFGVVETTFFNDYDYKIDAKYNAENLSIDFEIERNELDLSLIKRNYSDIFEGSKHPYDLQTLEKRIFKYNKPISQILHWKMSEKNKEILQEVGSFNFTFQYLNIVTSKKEGYPYKDIISSERKKILDRFGGIKIYRDSFRVRPYGENDWLKLGQRVAQSPAGPGQRIGDWRARPKNTTGIISISRVNNQKLIDKSDRSSLVENKAFSTFKKILIGIINQFEVDKSKILNKFYLENQKRKKAKSEAEVEKRVKELADKMFEDRLKEEAESDSNTQKPNNDTNQNSNKKEDIENLLRKSFNEFSKNDDNNAEIAQVRSLASLGLVVSSFAHELKKIKNRVGLIDKVEKHYSNLIDDSLKLGKDYNKGKYFINTLKTDRDKVEYWINYSLTSIKQDKRKRTKLNFENYFNSLNELWKNRFKERKIGLAIYRVGNSNNYNFRAFEMDLDTIFGNLITNSFEAFKGIRNKDRKKLITIKYQIINDFVEINYEDNGKGISESVFSDKDDIFLPFVTSKQNTDGTGLGMYLVKQVVGDYNGTISIINSEIGFKLKIEFPLRK